MAFKMETIKGALHVVETRSLYGGGVLRLGWRVTGANGVQEGAPVELVHFGRPEFTGLDMFGRRKVIETVDEAVELK